MFLGVVTDPGPSWATFFGELKKKLTPSQVERLESGDDLSEKEGREIMHALLPPEGRKKLRRARTEEDLERLMQEYFPILRERMRRVHFRIIETFQGEDANDRDVWTGQGYGDCGFDFEAGRTYLVYTYKDTETGRLETGICTRTRESNGEGEEIEYLREFRRGDEDIRVVGFVLGDYREWPGFMWGGRPKSGMEGISVLLRTSGDTWTATTDQTGRFSFKNLASGRYEISVAASHAEAFINVPRMLVVPARGCVQETLIRKRE